MKFKIITATLLFIAATLLGAVVGIALTYKPSKHRHSFKYTEVAATCTHKGYTLKTCYECNISYMVDFVDATGHTYVHHSGKAATCNEDGWNEYDTCTVCGYSTYEELHAHHVEVNDRDIAPTCTKKGWKNGTHCDVCGSTIISPEKIEKTGHSFTEWYVEEESTETVRGVYRRDCEACGIFERTPAPLAGCNYFSYRKIAATCNEYGYTEYKCADCHDVYKFDFTDMIPHTEWIEVIEPTCSTDGYSVHTCINCGESYVTDYRFATGHSYDEWFTETEAGCLTSGRQYRVCENCGEQDYATLEPIGHKYFITEKISEKEYVYQCENCGDELHASDGGQYQEGRENIQLFDVEESFTFTVIWDGDEQYLSEHLYVVDYCLIGTEYESEAAKSHVLNIIKMPGDDGYWLITPAENYAAGETFVACVDGGVTFGEYEAESVTFTVKRQESNVVEFSDGVMFLRKLENENPGYYPYSVYTSEESEFIYLVLQKADNLNVGDVIFVGEAESAEAIFDCGEECCFGKIDEIKKNDDGEYVLVLSCPDIEEVFKKLDVSYEQEINFDAYPEVKDKVEAAAVDCLYDSDDFAKFLAVADAAAQKHYTAKNLVAETITKANFSDKIKVVPQVSVKGTTITVKLTGSYENAVKTKTGTELGTFKINFTASASVGFKVSVDYKLKYWWFIPTGISYFDLSLKQTDSFTFDFNVEFSIDYELDKNYAEKYVHLDNSTKIHTVECIYVKGKDKDRLIYVKPENVSDYIEHKGFSACVKCRPVLGLNRAAFIKNIAEKVVHCYDCWHVTNQMAERNKAVYYGNVYNLLADGYKLCSYCRPQERDKRDFEEELLSTMEYADWAEQVNKIKSWAKSSGSGEYSQAGLKLCDIHQPVFGIISLNLEVKLVLNFKLEVSLKYHYAQSHTNVYGIRLQSGRVNTYSSHTQNENLSQLDIVGSMDFKVGVNANAYVSFVGLSKWVRAGFTAEAGVYMDLDGVAHVSNSINTNDYFAVYFEAGPYVDVGAYYKLFGLNGNVKIYSNKFPIFVYGYEKAYYAYVNEAETLDLKGGSLTLNTDKLLSVYYYDVKNHNTAQEILKTDSNKLYSVKLSLRSGKYCEILNGKLVVKKDAPCTFTDKLIITVTGNTTWAKYVKGSSAVFLDSRQIEISYTGGSNHNFVTVSNLPASCTVDGKITHICTICNSSYFDTIVASHNVVALNATEPTCTNTGLTDGAFCTACGTIFKEQMIIPAKGHNESVIKISDPDCIHEGVNYRFCLECKEVLNANEKVPALGHSYRTGLCIRCSEYRSADDLLFTLDENTYCYTVTGMGENKDAHILIPSEYLGVPVTGIDLNAFRGSDIETIVIPEGITSIGYCAFGDCVNLKQISLPSSLIYIDGFAFYNCCSLQEITLPENLREIARSAFRDCSNLINIEIPVNVTHIGGEAFKNCTALQIVVLSENITAIDFNAFDNCINLLNVYYTGDAEQWNAINISSGNICLLKAQKTFNYNNIQTGADYSAPVLTGVINRKEEYEF